MDLFNLSRETVEKWSHCVVGPEPNALCCLNASDLLIAIHKQHFAEYAMRVFHFTGESVVAVVGTEHGEAARNAWSPNFKGEIFIFSSDAAFNFTQENARAILAKANTLTQTIMVYAPPKSKAPRTMFAVPNETFFFQSFVRDVRGRV